MMSGNRQLFVNQNDQPDEHHVAGAVVAVAGDVVEGDGVEDGVMDGVEDGVMDGMEVGVAGDVEEVAKILQKQPNLVRNRV